MDELLRYHTYHTYLAKPRFSGMVKFLTWNLPEPERLFGLPTCVPKSLFYPLDSLDKNLG